jgi:putative oxidoreductase
MGVAVLIVRILIGGLLLVAGILKAHDGPSATAATIAGYRILPPVLVAPLGVALPYLEILLGGYLVAGLFARAAAYAAAAQFLLFAGAVASLVVRQIPANCGCFGSGVNTPPSWGHVAVDVALAAVTFAAGWFAPGRLAVDHWLSGGAGTAQTEGSDR